MDGFRATRRFRGTTYEIEVTRRRRAAPATADASIVVDGTPIDGTIIPIPPPGTALVRVAVALS